MMNLIHELNQLTLPGAIALSFIAVCAAAVLIVHIMSWRP